MSFWLEIKSLARSKTLVLLVLASALSVLLAPNFIVGDGTEDGRNIVETCYSMWGAVAIAAVAIASAAATSISADRAAKRLQLTLSRPVSFFRVAAGRIAALAVAGSLSVGVACAALAFRPGPATCRHVHRPVMESVQEEARRMYEAYMADPETAKELKRTRRSTVLRLLAQKAQDHYMPLSTNAVTSWAFSVPDAHARERATARMRFSDSFSLRRDVRGVLSFGGRTGAVTNITQAVLEIPLEGPAGNAAALEFSNSGESSLMLRPRRDIELMFDADSRGMNLFRAWIVLSSMMVLVAAFGVFLGAALSRPVAIWTVLSMLFLSLASPAVVDQYPHALDISIGDAAGLALSRAVSAVTSPLTAFSPVHAISENECVEWLEVGEAVALDAVLLPMALAALAALVMRRVKI